MTGQPIPPTGGGGDLMFPNPDRPGSDHYALNNPQAANRFSPQPAPGQQLWDFDETTGTLNPRAMPAPPPMFNPNTGMFSSGQPQGNQGGLVPGMFGQLGGLGNQQNSILSAFAPTMQGIAGGQIPQLLSSLVDQAYQPAIGNIATQAINNARERGFHGNELAGPGGAIAGPALADLQGQMAASKLGLLTQLPQAVATASGAYSTPMALRGQLGTNLSNLNQQLLQALGGIGQQGIQNGIGYLGAGSGLVNSGSGLFGNQQQGRIASGGQTTTTSQPSSLLDSFAPLASILGGLGGAFSAYGLSGQNPRMF